jgi:predicted esterase
VTASDLGFEHLFEPPTRPAGPTLLLLHGTGGDEHALVPIHRMLSASAGMLSPRGKVLENGMPRFFRRLAEGVFDVGDLKARTQELAAFVLEARRRYEILGPILGVGFSNGANIAASLLLLRPGVLSGAVLFRAMVPVVPEAMPAATGPVLVCEGRLDPLVPVAEAERLATLLRGAGYDVTLAWQPGGHTLTDGDLAVAKEWLGERFPPTTTKSTLSLI